MAEKKGSAFGEFFSSSDYRSKFIEVGGINQVSPGIATNYLFIAIAKKPMQCIFHCETKTFDKYRGIFSQLLPIPNNLLGKFSGK